MQRFEKTDLHTFNVNSADIKYFKKNESNFKVLKRSDSLSVFSYNNFGTVLSKEKFNFK